MSCNLQKAQYEVIGSANLGPLEATKPVILRGRINASEGKTRHTNQKYDRPFSLGSLTGAAFRAMTGRTVNPQVPGSSPGRGATYWWSIPDTWVTVYTGDMGNTFAANGFSALPSRPVS